VWWQTLVAMDAWILGKQSGIRALGRFGHKDMFYAKIVITQTKLYATHW